MERFNLSYSKKNIPVPSKDEYKLLLTAKTNSLIKRMRWKALQFLGQLPPTDKETYGFRSRKCPPVVAQLTQFEEDLMNMIRNIEFRQVDNELQRKMREDIKMIKQSGKVIVPADKSTNLYKIEKNEYEQYVTNNITKEYKKSTDNKVNEINTEAYGIAHNLDLEDRMERLQQTESYITVKDHKDDFPANPKFRLINPSKTDVGRVSKLILDKINKELLAKIGVNQWKSTQAVINWFKRVPEKSRCSFIKFDVDNFYPSITLELFNKAIEFAKQHVDISNDDLAIITQARKTLLYHNGQPWTKKNDESDFDVPMGSYDGAELCELVGAFMLSEISEVIDKKDIGLYRDDGLGVMRGLGRPEIERRKKKIIQIFKKHKLDITVSTGMHSVDYLDVEFDLKNNVFKPYKKPNNEPLYVHKQSNHPPNVLKQIPKGIARRLSDISSSQEIFQQASPVYEEALRKSGYDEELQYCPERPPRRNRKRQIIWFNPPYSVNVTTNIGKEFLRLLRVHFHRQHAFRKIFNKNTVKLSYSCTKNISSIISGHNKRVTRQEPEEIPRECNCRNREDCPLGGKCLTGNIVYEATVTSQPDEVTKNYVGLCSTPFKDRLGVHKQHMRNRLHRTKCKLADYVWDLKDSGKTYKVEWKILKEVRGRLIGGACRLCTTEKLQILEYPNQDRLLNKHCIEKCRHGEKYLLKSVRTRNRGRDTVD